MRASIQTSRLIIHLYRIYNQNQPLNVVLGKNQPEPSASRVQATASHVQVRCAPCVSHVRVKCKPDVRHAQVSECLIQTR